ncbi:hypothetical protein ACHAXT_012959 [Thalassiosira profunda]
MSETTDAPRIPVASPPFVPSPPGSAPSSAAWPTHSAGSWEAQNAAAATNGAPSSNGNPASSPTPPVHPHANPQHTNSYTFWNDLNEDTAGGDGGKHEGWADAEEDYWDSFGSVGQAEDAENPHGWGVGSGWVYDASTGRWVNEEASRDDGATDGARHPGSAEGAENDRDYYEGDDRYGDGYDSGWGGTAVVPPSGYGSYNDGNTPFDRSEEWENDDFPWYPPKYPNDRGARPGGVPAVRFKRDRGEESEERGSSSALFVWIGFGAMCLVLPFFFAWHRRRRQRFWAVAENARVEGNAQSAGAEAGVDGARLLEILKATTAEVQESDLIPNDSGGGRKRGGLRASLGGSLRLSRTESRGSLLRLNLSSVSLTALVEGDIETGQTVSGQCDESGVDTKRESHSTAPVSDPEDGDCSETDVGLDIEADDEQRESESAGEYAIAVGSSEAEKDLESGQPEGSAECVDAPISAGGDVLATSPADSETEKPAANEEPSHGGDPPSALLDNPATPLHALDESEDDNRYSALSLPRSNTTCAPADETTLQGEQIQRIVPNTCAICLVQYKPGCRVTWSPNSQCTHVFHRECIAQWLMKKEEPLCPCCRREFVPKSVLKDEDVDGDTGAANAPPDEVVGGGSENRNAGGG